MQKGFLNRKATRRTPRQAERSAALSTAGAHQGGSPQPADSTALPHAPTTFVKTQQVPGKGTCLVATQDIPAGTVVLSEAPLLLIENFAPVGEEHTFQTEQRKHRAVDESLRRLSPSDQRDFWSLHNSFPAWSPASLGTFLTNNWPAGCPSTRAVFRLACRASHSCNKNCCLGWDSDLDQLVRCMATVLPLTLQPLSMHDSGPASDCLAFLCCRRCRPTQTFQLELKSRCRT